MLDKNQLIINIERFAQNETIELTKELIKCGVKLVLKKNTEKITICIYKGKKGISKVLSGKSSEFKKHLENEFFQPKLLQNNCNKDIFLSNDLKYFVAGADEAGKGDYFGSLCVAAVFGNKEASDKLLQLGIRDSKVLSDKRIKELAEKIRKNFQGYFVEFSLLPEKYNEQFILFSKESKNLNDLLAWAHGKVANEVLKKEKNIKQYIIDKFTDDKKISRWLCLPKSIKQFNLVKAEYIPFVGAASILARDAFLSSLEQLGKQFYCIFPKGAGKIVNDFAEKLITKNGDVILSKCAKVHFKNTLNLKMNYL